MYNVFIMIMIIFSCLVAEVEPIILPAPPISFTSEKTQKISTIHIPVTTNTNVIKEKLEVYIPNPVVNFSGKDIGDRKTLQVILHKHGNLQMSTSNNYLHASQQVQGHVRVDWQKKIFGARIKKHATAHITATLKVSIRTDVKPDWSSKIDTKLSIHSSQAYIKVGPFKISIRSYIQSYIQKLADKQQSKIQAFAKKFFDKKLEKAYLKITKFWQEISGVHHISKTPDTWLSVVPVQARFTNMQAQNDQLKIGLGLDVILELVIGSKPAIPQIKPLGNLYIDNKYKESYIVSRIKILRTELQKTATKALQGKLHRFSSGVKLLVDTVDVYPSGNYIFLQIDGTLKGNASMFGDYISELISVKTTLFISCKPLFDPVTNEIVLKSVEIDNNILDYLKNRKIIWLADPDIFSSISNSIRFSLNKDIDQVKTRIQQLTRKLRKTQMALEINAIKLFKVCSNKDVVLFEFFITGNSSFAIR